MVDFPLVEKRFSEKMGLFGRRLHLQWMQFPSPAPRRKPQAFERHLSFFWFFVLWLSRRKPSLVKKRLVCNRSAIFQFRPSSIWWGSCARLILDPRWLSVNYQHAICWQISDKHPLPRAFLTYLLPVLLKFCMPKVSESAHYKT